MQIKQRNIGLTVDDSLMRVYIAEPAPEGKYPGIVFYSDIYQLGRPITLLADRLAGYGYVVAAGEIFHRLEPIGLTMEPGDLGRLRGNDDARRTEIREYDADTRAILDWLQTQENVDRDRLGSFGFCIGGHLAFRAAFESEVKAAVCCYPTGIHSGKLGRGVADSLVRLAEIQGELLMIFGTQDKHVPADGREKILQSLQGANVAHKTLVYEANHTFMRDDGYRYDPEATDRAWAEIMAFLERIFPR